MKPQDNWNLEDVLECLGNKVEFDPTSGRISKFGKRRKWMTQYEDSGLTCVGDQSTLYIQKKVDTKYIGVIDSVIWEYGKDFSRQSKETKEFISKLLS